MPPVALRPVLSVVPLGASLEAYIPKLTEEMTVNRATVSVEYVMAFSWKELSTSWPSFLYDVILGTTSTQIT